ncbi:MAG: hypothetical protein ACE5H9_09470 [Anaerolineae bacterium]
MTQVILLACPSCDFVIEQFSEEELETDKRRQKRYMYLRKKQTLCPNCLLATSKLKEMKLAQVEADEFIAAAPQLAETETVAEGVEEAGAETLETPLCDQLEEGRWPSHVTELKKSKYHLAMYEEGLRLRQTQWGFGGYVSLPGVAAGILVRASARPDIAGGANFVRMLPPSGSYYTSEQLRAVCDVADEHAYGILHLHSTGGDIEILGISTEGLRPAVDALNALGFDVGSTSDAYRNSVDCLGLSRCDAALVDAMDLRDCFYDRYLDDVQYPRFPHKLKVRFSGCPNDCARAGQKAGIAIVGVFRDLPQIDQDRLQEWIQGTHNGGEGGDIHHLVLNCPARALLWDGRRLAVDPDSCTRCMYCINKCSYAIRPGDDRGVAILVGAKLRGRYGPLIGKVLVPFIPANPPEYKEVFDVVDRIADVFDENARRKERLGDMIFRMGIDKFTRLCGLEASPYQLTEPRTNAWIHWSEEELQEAT